MKNNILIYDSGVGGLSVFKAMYSIMPNFNYVYYADTKNLPYGSKTKQKLYNIVSTNIAEIITKYNPVLIVFGCNTIGVTIFNKLKHQFKNIPMFSLKPNINFALKNKIFPILLLATPQTINNISKTNIYKANSKNIILRKMPELATKVEKYLQNPTNIVPYLKETLKEYNNVACIILGCSHYYFVKNELQTIFENAKIIDGTAIVVLQILKHIFKTNFVLTNQNYGKIKLILTGHKSNILQYKKIIKNIKNKTKQLD